MMRSVAVVDLFCGVGGMTRGFLDAKLKVVAGIDSDDNCKFPYEINNPGAKFISADLFSYSSDEVKKLFGKAKRKVLIGCAPCQPFSKYASTKKRDLDDETDNRWKLVERFGEIIGEVQPDVVSMENVPNLISFDSGKIFKKFVTQLEDAEYKYITFDSLYCPDYGIPQTRKRLVLLASKLGPIHLPVKTHQPHQYVTVAQTIKDLADITAGEIDPYDRIHRSRKLQVQNLARIRYSKPGGTWLDWPEELRLACHQREGGESYNDVYGRMRWDQPAPTLTTQFYNYGTGRFGHPEQDRAISFREGALLQTFPKDYIFEEPNQQIQQDVLGRLIGNAVPVKLAEAIAKAIKLHLEKYRA